MSEVSSMFRVVIPSRYQATRLPAKLLMDIHGKSMLQRVYEQARLSDAAEVMIAADDERIFSHAKCFNANVVMTATHHQSGTERIAELIEKLQLDEITNTSAQRGTGHWVENSVAIAWLFWGIRPEISNHRLIATEFPLLLNQSRQIPHRRVKKEQ